MRDIIRPLTLLTIVLAIPIVPLLIWGEMFTGQLSQWQELPPDRWALAVGVTAILASDIFLPVPSGPVTTLAGAQLGILLGTICSWLGMTLGALIAFVLARRWGLPLANRVVSAADLQRLKGACQRNGTLMVLITRPVPVFAEACVLLVGICRAPWRQFLPAIVVSNLIISVVYCVLGDYSAEHQWLPLAICLSLAIPLGLALWARRRLGR